MLILCTQTSFHNQEGNFRNQKGFNEIAKYPLFLPERTFVYSGSEKYDASLHMMCIGCGKAKTVEVVSRLQFFHSKTAIEDFCRLSF